MRFLNYKLFTTEDKNYLIYLGELVGTFFFLTIAYLLTGVANDVMLNAGIVDNAQVQSIAIAFGFGLTLSILAFGDLSGGHFNPSVSFTLFLLSKISFIRFVGELIVQLIGGMAAAGAASAWLPGPVNFANAKNINVNVGRALTLEAFGAFLLSITVMVVISKGVSFISAAFTIGFSLFMGHMICVPVTGAGLNPARSFGPAVAARSFPGYFWIYMIGPFIGSMFAAIFTPLALAILNREQKLTNDLNKERVIDEKDSSLTVEV